MTAFFSIEDDPHSGIKATGGRTRARRLVLFGVSLIAAFVSAAQPIAASDDGSSRNVSVKQKRGVYTVTARFTVPQPSSIVTAVLTDYEDIPRFMPDIHKSVVLERTAGFTVVEQEAVARMLMFSKRVHLVLEVRQQGDVIRFHDRCATSFSRYEGMWEVVQTQDGTLITYELIVQPSFDVPEFLLGRALRGDANRMIERLRNEIGRRDARVAAAH